MDLSTILLMCVAAAGAITFVVDRNDAAHAPVRVPVRVMRHRRR